MSKNNHRGVFDNACLVQFSTSLWQCSKMLDQHVMHRIGENTQWLRGRKYIINPELLGPCRTAVHQARDMLKRFGLPFPITSIYLIPKESVQVVDERLTFYKNRYWEKFKEFEALYDEAREEAKKNLGELFNETDYPVNIATRFNFEWRYLTITLPGKTSVLTPEIYEREKKKFLDLMEETKELAMTALREEFGAIVHHLVDRLGNSNGKPKTINGSMFNKLKTFLEDMGSRNIFQDETLIQLTEEAKAVIEGVSPYGLKYNPNLRDEIKKSMADLKDAIDASIEEMPRRQIRVLGMDA